MPKKIAASLALVAFALCLIVGMQARNSFTTTLLRALFALSGTYVIGIILGAVVQRMLDENLELQQEKLKDLSPQTQPKDR